MASELRFSAAKDAAARNKRVALVYFPHAGKTVYKFVDQILCILIPISDFITVVGGGTELLNEHDSARVRFADIGITMHHNLANSPSLRLSKALWGVKAVLVQVLEAAALIKNARNIDVVLFYISYPSNALPLIAAKMLRKKTWMVMVTSGGDGRGLISYLQNLHKQLIYSMTDIITPESKRLVPELALGKYGAKVVGEGYRYVDTERYRIEKEFGQRTKVGFISRLEEKKGTLNFLRAVEIIQRNAYSDVSFLIGGDGPLRHVVEAEVSKLRSGGARIEYLGWIPETKFPHYLNELKVLVFPTTVEAKEGLPTIILEAMACGTPALTTPVAAIPDVINDGATGFFLESSSPEHIAKGILRVLTCEGVNKVREQARALVEKRFSYASAVERWDAILNGT
jgi:glycosyltransferase involved in cell wall biosynthesis